MRNRIAALLAALAIPLFAALGTAVPAAAAATAVEFNTAKDIDWYSATRDCYTITALSACVQPNGDDIWIWDKKDDGYPVQITWWDGDGSREGVCYDNLGPSKVWVYCNKDWTEGHTIYWYAEWYDDGQWWSGFTQTTPV
ncbi:hypothetical protein AB0A73_03725 [Glycomyces sp. NPDC047369]